MNKLITQLHKQQQQLATQMKEHPLIKAYLLPTLGIVISLAVLGMVTIPQFLNYLETQKQITELDSQVNTLANKLDLLQQVEFDQSQEQLATTLKAFPTDKDYIVTAAQLQLLAQQNSVGLSAVGFGEGGNEGRYQVRLSVAGTLEEIRLFIQAINNAPRLMQVENVDVTLNRDIYEANLTVLVPYAKLVPEVVAVDQPTEPLTETELTLLVELAQSFSQSPEIYEVPNVQLLGKPNPFE